MRRRMSQNTAVKVCETNFVRQVAESQKKSDDQVYHVRPSLRNENDDVDIARSSIPFTFFFAENFSLDLKDVLFSELGHSLNSFTDFPFMCSTLFAKKSLLGVKSDTSFDRYAGIFRHRLEEIFELEFEMFLQYRLR